jgi:hypothetical protein
VTPPPTYYIVSVVLDEESGGERGRRSDEQMKNAMIRHIGGIALNRAARNYIGEGKRIDAKLGIALFRDRRVPVPAKMAAIALGFVLMTVLNALQLPLDAVIAFLLPFVGLGVELMWNGAETLIGTLLFSALALPFVAPKGIVERIRAERAGPIPVAVENIAR